MFHNCHPFSTCLTLNAVKLIALQLIAVRPKRKGGDWIAGLHGLARAGPFLFVPVNLGRAFAKFGEADAANMLFFSSETNRYCTSEK